MRRKANLDDPVIQIDVRIPDSHARALKLGKSYRDVYVILNEPNEFQCAFFESRALAFWETDLDKPEAIFAAVLTESAIFPPVAAAS